MKPRSATLWKFVLTTGLALLLCLLAAITYLHLSSPRALLALLGDIPVRHAEATAGLSQAKLNEILLQPPDEAPISITTLVGTRGPEYLFHQNWEHLWIGSWETEVASWNNFIHLWNRLLPLLGRGNFSQLQAPVGQIHWKGNEGASAWSVQAEGHRDAAGYLEVLGEARSPLFRLEAYLLLADLDMESSLHLNGIWFNRPSDSWPAKQNNLPYLTLSRFAADISQVTVESTFYLTPMHRVDSAVVLFQGSGHSLGNGINKEGSVGLEALSGGITWRRGQAVRLVADALRGPRRHGAVSLGHGAFEIRWREDGPLWIYSGPISFQSTDPDWSGSANVAIELQNPPGEEAWKIVVSGSIQPGPGEGESPLELAMDLRWRTTDPGKGWELKDIRLNNTPIPGAGEMLPVEGSFDSIWSDHLIRKIALRARELAQPGSTTSGP